MMNKNSFEEEYAAYKEINARFDAADLADNEEQKSLARAQFKTLKASLLSKGDTYFRMFESYREAKDCGNEYIDLHEVIWDNQVEGLINTFRELGVEHFTFSSTWSSAVATAWLFKENGCELEGLVMINSHYKKALSDEYETAPAYLFKVN